MKSAVAKNLFLITVTLLFLMSSCKKDFLSKAESEALFAVPSAAEKDSVYNEWQKRDLSPADYAVVQEYEILSGHFKLKIVSFKVSGIKEYGFLLIPKTDSLVPVHVYVGGFDLNNTINSLILVEDTSGSNNPYVLAVPALRGQSLEITIDGILYTSPLSEGDQCDAFDGATDDVIAFLNLIQQTESYADVNRTAVRGGSRGGTVALLSGIRDERVKRVVGVAGPTDLLELTSPSENDLTYQCQFLNNFKIGAATLTEARMKMIASSPIYFAQYLPLAQLHMGLQDEIVPIKQANDFEVKINELGLGATFQLFTYDRSHSDIATNNTELEDRIEQFLSQL